MAPLASARERGAIGCASRVAGAAHQISILSQPLVALLLFTDTRDGALAAGSVIHALDTLLAPIADGVLRRGSGSGSGHVLAVGLCDRLSSVRSLHDTDSQTAQPRHCIVPTRRRYVTVRRQFPSKMSRNNGHSFELLWL